MWGAISATPEKTRNIEPFSACFPLGGMPRKSSRRPPASAEREPGRLAHDDIIPHRELQLCPSRISPAARLDAIRSHPMHTQHPNFSLRIRMGAKGWDETGRKSDPPQKPGGVPSPAVHPITKPAPRIGKISLSGATIDQVIRPAMPCSPLETDHRGSIPNGPTTRTGPESAAVSVIKRIGCNLPHPAGF